MSQPSDREWENDHNVYILGAGFSADSGVPVVSDFLIRMREAADWLAQAGRMDELTAIRNVLNFRREAASAAYYVRLNLDNIETLFSLAAAQGSGERADVVRAISATIAFARATRDTHRAIVCVREDLDGPSRPTSWRRLDKESNGSPSTFRYEAPQAHLYAGVIGGTLCAPRTNCRNTVISFNYDTLVEDAWRELGQQFSYGLPRPFNEGIDPDFGGDATAGAPHIYKLHGSMNWSVDATNVRLHGSYDGLLAAGHTPLIVPPTWQKDLGGPLAPVWEGAVNALRTATRVFILGFSMPETDSHFRYLLGAGLRDNVSLQGTWFINPQADDIEMRRRLDALFISGDGRQLNARDLRANIFFLTREWNAIAGRPLGPKYRMDSNSLVPAGALVSPDAPR